MRTLLPYFCLILGLLPAWPVRSGDNQSVEYLYIDAGEGDSSGGHAAIQFGNDIFHFQYFDGDLLRAVREDSDEFQFKYRFLGNRSISVSSIPVSAETYSLLRDHFNHGYMARNQQFGVLYAIKRERELVELLLSWGGASQAETEPLSNEVLQIRGAGLFLPASDSPQRRIDRPKATDALAARVNSALATRIEKSFGSDYFHRKMAALQKKILSIKITRWDASAIDLSQDRYPLLPYTFADRYSDALSIMTALSIVQRGLSLYADVQQAPEFPEYRLDKTEMKVLRAFQRQTMENLTRLVASHRPDWGYAFMVGLGRLMVLESSIQKGRLVFLDTFGNSPGHIPQDDIKRYQKTFRSLLEEARSHFTDQKVRLLSKSRINEQDYSALELAANRYFELVGGVEGGKAIRIHRGNLAPVKSSVASGLWRPRLSHNDLRQGLNQAIAYERKYREKLQDLYPYNLLLRNCVTEIFLNINQAFENHLNAVDYSRPVNHASLRARVEEVRMESTRRLGGYVATSPFNIIPFASADEVNKTYRLLDTRKLTSYRKKRLQEMFRQENPILAYPRESNVLSSTLYKLNPDDSFFIFFTDDTVVPRPVFGVVNAIAGVGQSIVGLFVLPVDGGDVLRKGIRGFLMSLPELVFFNMRKGSYRYQPYDELMGVEEASL